MNLDLSTTDVLFVVASITTLFVIRVAIVPDGVSFEDLFARHWDPGWPRGVQEEEPVRWRMERLTRPARLDPVGRRQPDTSRRRLVSDSSSGSAGHPAGRRSRG